jgi:hypothetical protein
MPALTRSGVFLPVFFLSETTVRKADVPTVRDIQTSAQNGKIAQCHFPKTLTENEVATFLIGAGEYAYIGYYN